MCHSNERFMQTYLNVLQVFQIMSIFQNPSGADKVIQQMQKNSLKVRHLQISDLYQGNGMSTNLKSHQLCSITKGGLHPKWKLSSKNGSLLRITFGYFTQLGHWPEVDVHQFSGLDLKVINGNGMAFGSAVDENSHFGHLSGVIANTKTEHGA